MREIPLLVPHADYGDTECCAIVIPVERGDQADLMCNQCGAIIMSVAVAVDEAEPSRRY